MNHVLRWHVPTLRIGDGWLASVLRVVALCAIAFGVFALVLLAFGKNPVSAYADIFASTLGNTYGISEVLVRMIPLMLTALAVAVPSRIWLINVGGEGQLYVGALFASWGALNLRDWPPIVLLPTMVLLGFVGGGLWALIAGVMRAKGWVSETIATLLMNYVATLLVSFFVFGEWKDTASANYPQTAQFPDAGILPSFFGTRVHLGLVFALVALLVFAFVMARTRWGLEMRAIGGNAEAARRNGLDIARYVMLLMFIGGGLAGLAGMSEVSAIQGRLRLSLSPGYGFTGFLIGWMSNGHPLGIVAASFLLAVITSGGDILQMSHGLPAAAVNVLMALILFVVLARRNPKAGAA